MAKKRKRSHNPLDLSSIPRVAVPPPTEGDEVSKFTPAIRKTIIGAIRNGCLRYQACALAGIVRQTLVNWEEKGSADPEGEYGQFLAELEQAQYAAEAQLQYIHHALATGGKLPDNVSGELMGQLGEFRQRALLPAIQAQLKYGGSRPWAEIQQIELSGKGGGPIRVSGEPTPEAAAALVRSQFGDQARKALREEEEAATSSKKSGE